MLPPARSYPPSGFHDIVIPRAGVEWRAWQRPKLALDLRAGYSYEPTPGAGADRREQLRRRRQAHVLGGRRARASARMTAILPQPLAIDVHFAGTYLPPRTNRKVDPLDHVGDFVADGVVLQLGLMLRSRF